MIRSLLCFVTILLVASTSFGATYYIATTGNDTTGTGTSGNPWATLHYGAAQLSAGDTLIVKNGTYTGTPDAGITHPHMAQITKSGTAENWITIKAETQWGAVLDGENNTVHFGIIFSTGAQYIRIEDFEIKGYKYGGISINQKDTNNIYIYRNHVHHIGNWTTTYAGLDAIETYAGDPALNYARHSTYCTFDSNLVHHIGKNSDSDPNKLNVDHGIYLRGKYHTAINNIFYNIDSGYAIKLSGWGTDVDNYCTVYNNTIIASNYNDYAFWGEIWVVSSSNTVENNIIVVPTGKESVGGAIKLVKKANGTCQANNFFRNNLTNSAKIYDFSVASDAALGCGSGVTLANNVVSVVPTFTGTVPSTTPEDYQLAVGSGAIDVGRNTGVVLDWGGTVRPQNSIYDIGAWEYVNNPAPVETSGSLTIYPTKDAYIDSSLINNNYGEVAWTGIRYDGTKQLRDLMLFDFSSLPDGATITKAEIHKYVYLTTGTGSLTDKTAYIKRLTRTDWVETGVDWDDWGSNSGDDWVLDGGDFVETYKASTTLHEQGGTDIYDVTEMVQWCGTNTSELLSVINLYTGILGITKVPWFRTREHTTDSEKVKLVIDYTAIGVPSTPLPPNRWGRLFRVFGF